MIMTEIADQKIHLIAALLKITAVFNAFWIVGALVNALIIVPSMEGAGLSVCYDLFLLRLQSLLEVALIVSIVNLSRRRKNFLPLSSAALGFILCLYGFWWIRSLAISGYLSYQFTMSEIESFSYSPGSSLAMLYGGSWWNILVLLNIVVAFVWHLWWLNINTFISNPAERK
jgi:hypothetical protein